MIKWSKLNLYISLSTFAFQWAFSIEFFCCTMFQIKTKFKAIFHFVWTLVQCQKMFCFWMSSLFFADKFPKFHRSHVNFRQMMFDLCVTHNAVQPMISIRKRVSHLLKRLALLIRSYLMSSCAHFHNDSDACKIHPTAIFVTHNARKTNRLHLLHSFASYGLRFVSKWLNFF